MQTNYVDRLDPALLRPGRIDTKVEYHPATREQASALFLRFFARPGTSTGTSAMNSGSEKAAPLSRSKLSELTDLAAAFASHVPPRTFSTAELQGFLLLCKNQPELARKNIKGWVEGELMQRKEKEHKEEERKKKEKEKRGAGGGGIPDTMAARLAAMYGFPPTPTTPTPAYADSQKQAGVVVVSGDAADEEESESSTASAEVVGSE